LPRPYQVAFRRSRERASIFMLRHRALLSINSSANGRHNRSQVEIAFELYERDIKLKLIIYFVQQIDMASKGVIEAVIRNNPDIILAPDHGIDYIFITCYFESFCCTGILLYFYLCWLIKSIIANLSLCLISYYKKST